MSGVYQCKKPVTRQPMGKRSVQYLTAARWLLTKTGWGATNHFEAGAFVHSSETSDWPDLQLQFSPHAFSRSNNGLPVDVHGFQVHAGPQRPKSRGRVCIRSDRHNDSPIIDPNYLSHPDDWRDLETALLVARDVLSQKAFDPFRGLETGPGARVQSRSEIDAYIRETANTGYHPCGTCKMGSGPDAVVDGALRVHSLSGLRVCDSSIIPTITSGNLNAPTIMIGEKASDLIRNQ